MAGLLFPLSRLTVGLVLAIALTGKLRSFGAFRDSVAQWFPFLARAAAPAAIVFLALEAAILAGLAAGGSLARLALASAALLFALLIAAMAVPLAQRRAVQCACFGGAAHRLTARDLVRNGVLAALAGLPLAFPGQTAPVSPLTFVLAAILAVLVIRRSSETPFTVAIGQGVPAFAGWSAAGPVRSADHLGTPVALVFLNATCPDCAKKIPQLEEMLPAMRRQELLFWIVGVGAGRDISALMPGSALLDHLLVLDAEASRRLDPRDSAPFYLFLDDRHVAVASNFIGDEDWLSFVDQMSGADA